MIRKKRCCHDDYGHSNIDQTVPRSECLHLGFTLESPPDWSPWLKWKRSHHDGILFIREVILNRYQVHFETRGLGSFCTFTAIPILPFSCPVCVLLFVILSCFFAFEKEYRCLPSTQTFHKGEQFFYWISWSFSWYLRSISSAALSFFKSFALVNLFNSYAHAAHRQKDEKSPGTIFQHRYSCCREHGTIRRIKTGAIFQGSPPYWF